MVTCTVPGGTLTSGHTYGFEISVSDGVLHISAKREDRVEHTEEGTYRSEFRYGMFSRDFVLPVGVDHHAVKATYKDGILEVTMPWTSDDTTMLTKVPISRA